MQANAVAVAGALKAADYARHSSLLYAPQDRRAALAALYAFDVEIAAIARRVSEPLPGEIRIQWWQEVIAGERREEAAGNPLASELLATIREHRFPPSAFERYLDARVADLYHDAFPDRVSLEAWCGETSGAILQMSALVLDGSAAANVADAAGHGGCLVGIAELLRGMALARKRGKVTIPLDILSACGLTAGHFLAERTPAHDVAVAAFVALARDHLASFRTAVRPLPGLRPAFLAVGIAELEIARAAKDPAAILTAGLAPPAPLSVQWNLLRRAAGGW